PLGDVRKRIDYAANWINKRVANKNQVADEFSRLLTDPSAPLDTAGKPLVAVPDQKGWRVQCFENDGLLIAKVINPPQDKPSPRLGFFSFHALKETLGDRQWTAEFHPSRNPQKSGSKVDDLKQGAVAAPPDPVYVVGSDPWQA